MKRYTTTAREGMTAADVLNMSGEDLQTLAAAAVENAMKRREADSGRDLLQMRVKYTEDARQEAALEMLDRASSEWMTGEPFTLREKETGEAVTVERPALPLAYFAALCAGRAVDRLIYADGGRAVKLAARERREYYNGREDAPRPTLEQLSNMADAVTAGEIAPEAYTDAARAYYAGSSEAYTETRRTSSPVAPAPEAAAIEAERVERIFSALPAETLPRALDMARAMSAAADSVREAGRLAGLTEATARRTWAAVKAAAADVLREDGDSAALERMIEEGERRRAAKDRAARDASEAARAKALKAAAPAAAGAVRFTAGRPDRLAQTAKHTPESLEALRKLARALFDAQAK